MNLWPAREQKDTPMSHETSAKRHFRPALQFHNQNNSTTCSKTHQCCGLEDSFVRWTWTTKMWFSELIIHDWNPDWNQADGRQDYRTLRIQSGKAHVMLKGPSNVKGSVTSKCRNLKMWAVVCHKPSPFCSNKRLLSWACAPHRYSILMRLLFPITTCLRTYFRRISLAACTGKWKTWKLKVKFEQVGGGDTIVGVSFFVLLVLSELPFMNIRTILGMSMQRLHWILFCYVRSLSQLDENNADCTVLANAFKVCKMPYSSFNHGTVSLNHIF